MENAHTVSRVWPWIGALTVVCAAGVLTSIEPVLTSVALVLGVASLFVFFRYPFLVLLAIVALVPVASLGTLSSVDNYLSLTKLLFPPLMLLVCWKQIVNREPFRLSPQTVLLLLFGAAVLFAAFFADGKLAALSSLRRYASMFMLYFIILQMVKTERHVAVVLAIMVGASLVASLGGAANPDALKAAAELDRFTGLGAEDANFFAMDMGVALFICVAAIVHAKTPAVRFVALCAMFAFLWSIVSSESRGAFVSLVGCGVYSLYVLRAHIRRLPFAAIGLALIAGAVVLLLIPAEYWERVQSIADTSSDTSLQRRLSYHIIGLRLLVRSPLWGVGPGNFPRHFASEEFRYLANILVGGRAMHNLFFLVLVEIGLFGFVLFGATLVKALRRLAGIRKQYAEQSPLLSHVALAVQLSLVSLLLSSTFLPAIFAKNLWILLALSASVSAIAREREGQPSVAPAAGGAVPLETTTGDQREQQWES